MNINSYREQNNSDRRCYRRMKKHPELYMSDGFYKRDFPLDIHRLIARHFDGYLYTFPRAKDEPRFKQCFTTNITLRLYRISHLCTCTLPVSKLPYHITFDF